ncbi:unnamed protein product [Rotaria socialis]
MDITTDNQCNADNVNQNNNTEENHQNLQTLTTDAYLKALAISSYNGVDTNARKPLTKLLNSFQLTSEILPLFRQINDKDDHNSAFVTGQEINETYEKTITAIISAKLEISEQPQKFWRKRTINCLKKKWCPVIQGRSGKQRHYIGIQFVFVQLLSYDNQSQQSKILVPPDTTAKSLKQSGKEQKIKSRRQTISDLAIQDIYGFDKLTNTILCPISEKEYNRCKKDLKLIMLSLCKETDDDDDHRISITEIV